MLSKIEIWIGDNVDRVSLIVTVTAAIVILAFSSLGLIDLTKHSNEAIISLLCLMAISLYMVAGHSKRSAVALDTKVAALQTDLDHKFAKVCGDLQVQVSECHDALTKKVIHATGGIEYYAFRNSTEFMNYLADRISQAESSVYDLTWVENKHSERPPGYEEAEQKYHSAIIRNSNRIQYRDVYIFCDKPKYQKLQKILEQNPLPQRYHCRYYPNSKIPRPVFVIIDESEVLLYGIAAAGMYCSVRHVPLVEMFKNFYLTVWSEANKLKDGPTIYKDEYNKVMQGLKSSVKA